MKKPFGILEKIRKRAQTLSRRVVLPEGDDLRVIKAAAIAAKENIAQIILLGDKVELKALVKDEDIDISKIKVINPVQAPEFREYVKTYYQLRAHKGINLEQAGKVILNNNLYFAALMVRQAQADGFVGGAKHTTSSVARAALQCLERQEGISTASGAMFIVLNNLRFGYEGALLFADCAITPNPSAKQLANIAVSSARLFSKIVEVPAQVAMLSYSTQGSSNGPLVEKIRKATEIVKSKFPELLIEGELQADAAIVPEVARAKAPNSRLAGKANVLIFPNLDAGNITYKLVQRLANVRAIGPVIQGLKNACSDLSRGCAVEDIVDAIAITAVRAR
jgi:phosphate acetyltransferase